MTLQNNTLIITLHEPGSFYEGTRFDWSSQVSSVKNAAGQEYLSNELFGNLTNKNQGFGLASEFGIRMPVGFDNAKEGEWFPKIGVGWLKKEANPEYDFMHKYQCELPVTNIAKSPNRISITMDSGERRGYAFRLSRTWTLVENTLTSEVLLHNSGEMPLLTNEYCHNFIKPGPVAIDDPETCISFSFNYDQNPEIIVDPYKVIQLGKLGLYFTGPSDKDLFVSKLGNQLPPDQSWTITHKQKPWVREQLDTTTAFCSFWGKSHVFSPELYLDVNLKPGESQHYKRTWTFS